MTPARWGQALRHLQATGRLPAVAAAVWTSVDEPTSLVEPVETTDTQYRIGSITKTMTAVAVLQLRDAGRLSLDDPLGRFIPESGYADSTLRSLLSHTSGMQSEPVGSWWERSPGVDFERLNRLNTGAGAVAGAGDYFHYSNLGYGLLGEVVARVHDRPWWTVIRDDLLAPLGLNRTTYDEAAPAAQGQSVDHYTGTLRAEPHQDTQSMAAAGQLWSTVGDLARWANFLANGHLDLVSRATLDEMATPVAPATDYGLGLHSRAPGWRGHHGSMPGFQATLAVNPQQGRGFVVLANSTVGLDMEPLPELFFGEAPIPESAAWVPTVDVPAVVAPVLGQWFWGNTAAEVIWHNERLNLHLRTPTASRLFETFALEGDQFIGTSGYHRGETLQIHRREDGSVHYLECATFVYTRMPYDPTAPTGGNSSSTR